MSFNARRNDVAKFSEGTWVEIFGGHFKVARAGNPGYEKALENSGFRKLDDPQDKQVALLKAVSRGILKDWSEVIDDKGEAIPFNVDNAVQVLQENPDLLGRVLEEANDLRNYRREDVEEQVGKPAAG